MKATHDWHRTPAGTIVRWLGSVQLAVPLLAVVSAAMVWGTYIESTRSARAAKDAVYGSGWFIALMVLVCLSLIFAVVTRYPWKRKHVGFMMVHASLIALIVGGFWSLFGRIEGRIVLEQGTSADAIELDEEYLELLEHDGGQFRVVAAARPPAAPATVRLGDVTVQIAERWANTREEFDVADGGPEPYRAVEMSFGPSMGSTWIGEESKNGAAKFGELTIRLLSPGQAWEPPAAPPPAGAEVPGFYFLAGEQKFPLGKEGDEAFPGWTIERIATFTHATVSSSGIEESKDAAGKPEDNPAVDVTITDGQGTRERHTCFQKFPDMVLVKTIEGTVKSGARLTATGAAKAGSESLVIFGDPGSLKVGYVDAGGSGTVVSQSGRLPWSVQVGKRSFSILREFTRVQEVSRFVKALPADETRPALLLTTGAGGTPAPLAWKGTTAVGSGNAVKVLRYGPRSVPLGFSLRLDEFRKMDYPGTDMAMAYESDVTVTAADEADSKARIFMNNPLKKAGWKVYQSGFSGTRVSIFSVMKDPGLPLTYLGSVGLCVGIVVTFYSRGFSWGHPGIPAPSFRKEHSDGVATPMVARPSAGDRDPAGGGRLREHARDGVPVGAVD